MTCPVCAKGKFKKQPTVLEASVKEESVQVEMNALVCTKCQFKTLHGDDMAEYMRLAADAYRRRHGLLTSEEIKACRVKLGMSQQRFSRYLHVGVASVKRWELGQVQDEAMDHLIRLKTDRQLALANAQSVCSSDPWETAWEPSAHASTTYSQWSQLPEFNTGWLC